MKSIQDVKKEYKDIFVNDIMNSYNRFKRIKEDNLYRDMSPDTRKEVTKEEDRFSWYRTMNEKLEQEFIKWDDPFDPKNFCPPLEIDLLNMEELTEKQKFFINHKKNYNKNLYRASFNDKNVLKEIAANDILNEYPIFKIANTIQRSVGSIESSHLRAEKAKTTSFENAVKEVKDLVSKLSKYKIYSLDCDNVISIHQTFFEHSKGVEEKEQHVRAILKLRDQILEHEKIIYDTVYDNNGIANHKSFTSKFLNSEYSLTEEEAIWWNKNKAQTFKECKVYESLGIAEKETLQFLEWKKYQNKIPSNQTKSKDLYTEIYEVVLKEARATQQMNRAIDFDLVKKMTEDQRDMCMNKDYVKEYINEIVSDKLNGIINDIEATERHKIQQEVYMKKLESLLPKDLIEDYILWGRTSSEANQLRYLSMTENGIDENRFVKEFFNHKIYIPLIHELIYNAVDQVEINLTGDIDV